MIIWSTNNIISIYANIFWIFCSEKMSSVKQRSVSCPTVPEFAFWHSITCHLFILCIFFSRWSVFKYIENMRGLILILLLMVYLSFSAFADILMIEWIITSATFLMFSYIFTRIVKPINTTLLEIIHLLVSSRFL